MSTWSRHRREEFQRERGRDRLEVRRGTGCRHNAVMDEARWDAVDKYVTSLLVHEDEALKAASRASDAAGLPAIAVTPAHGKLLHLLARMQKASSILEIGTLGGYSTIWLARALEPGGRVVTLEADPKHVKVARSNFERAHVSDRIDIRPGPAIDTLPTDKGCPVRPRLHRR